jgi:hypothetical protein
MQINETLRESYNKIINTMTTEQYFNWFRVYYNGQPDYKELCETIKLSTKSKKIHKLCDETIKLYNELITKQKAV